MDESLEVLAQLIGRLVTTTRILVDALENDRFQVARYAGIQRARRGWLALDDPVDQLQLIGSRVGRLQRQQLVQRQSQRIDVGPHIALTFETLGRHVADRAQNIAGVGHAMIAGLGQTEVGDPHDAVTVQQADSTV